MLNSNDAGALVPAGNAVATSDIGSRVSDGEFALPSIFLQYWQSLVRWRLLAAGIIASSLLLGVIITMLMAPHYTARTQIEISREQKDITNVKGLESRSGGLDLEFYATQYSLLKAQSLAERVVRRMRLARSEEFYSGHGLSLPAVKEPQAVAPNVGVDGASTSQMRDLERQAAAVLLKNISVEPVRTSRLIDIKYTSRSPQLSARIANAWVQEFIGATMDRQFASTADARRFLEDRLEQLRQKLEESERQVVTYASNRDIVSLETARDADGKTSSQRTLAQVDLEALNAALAQARADRIMAESRVGSGSVESSAEVINSPVVNNLRSQREQLAAQYSALLVRFEPAYPQAVEVKRQIDALDASIRREVARVGGSRTVVFNEAVRRENELSGKVARLKGQLDQQRKDSIQFNIFQREADTNRQLYDALLQRYKEIGVAGSVGANNIAIVDVASPPTAPSAPSMAINLALALLAGLALSGLAIFILEQIDEGIRTPDDIRSVLNLPLLGNVPKAQGNPLDELNDPKSHVAEAYFSIRTTLALSTTHGLPTTLVVTSTQPGEGKSTTSVSLARVLSRAGKRVLLIDGDLRSPSLHEYVGASNSLGFSNALAGDDEHMPIHQTEAANLSLMTAGPPPPNPAELLSSDRFKELMDRFLKSYDHVVIDAPPVLGLADTLLMGTAVDGVVYVVEAERTSRRAVRDAVQRLQASGCHIFGVIVTKIDYSRHSYGYGYGYGYSYGTNYGSDDKGQSPA